MRVALRGDELLVVRRPLQRAHLLRARATLTVGVTRATPDTHPAHCSAHTCPRERVAGYGCRRARSAWLQARVGCRRARLRLRATVAGYGRRLRSQGTVACLRACVDGVEADARVRVPEADGAVRGSPPRREEAPLPRAPGDRLDRRLVRVRVRVRERVGVRVRVSVRVTVGFRVGVSEGWGEP